MIYLDIAIRDRHSSRLFLMISRRESEEPATATTPESTLIIIHRCQVCNREQQQGNLPICLDCQNNDEIVREMQNNSIPVSQYVNQQCH